MNIVTICEYDLNDRNNFITLIMFIEGIRIHCKNYHLYILTSDNKNTRLKTLLSYEKNISIIYCKPNNAKVHRNINHKLYYLCNLDFDFIYLDFDMYVNADLNFLWSRRKEKPFIATIHQPNIVGKIKGRHTYDNNHFINSGLQIVSDKDFLNYDDIFNFGSHLNFKFSVSGFDQALLNDYFKYIKYDFTHKDIGFEWNSCAGISHAVFNRYDDIEIMCINEDEKYPVMVNHYWDEFKPWNIDCPIFYYYKDILSY